MHRIKQLHRICLFAGVSVVLSVFSFSAQAQPQEGLRGREEISFVEFVRSLNDREKDVFLGQLERGLAPYIPDMWVRQTMVFYLKDAIKKGLSNPYVRAQLDRMPTLPVTALSLSEIVHQRGSHETPQSLQPMRGIDLKEFFANISRPRIFPVETSLSPRLKYGHFPDMTLTELEHSQSVGLAEWLQALSRGDGSYAVAGGRDIRSVAELMAYLRQDHEITFKSERMYANFLSFTVDDTRYLRWPVWIRTEVQLDDGQYLLVPAGHSQFAWEVRGPLVNAKVAFYLGTRGAGFFPQVSERPAWTGKKVVRISQIPAVIQKTLEAAAQYLSLNRIEKNTIAKGKPADGYGVIGTCNDSVAMMEWWCGWGLSTYPLVRDPKLRAPTRDPQLQAIYAGIRDFPWDMVSDGTNQDAQVQRILAMDPCERNLSRGFDTLLDSQMRSLRRIDF